MTHRPKQTVDTTRTTPNESAFVVGGGDLGREVADRLTENGERVTLVDRAPPTDPPPGQSVIDIDALDATGLAAADFGDATTALVLEPNDAANLLVVQLARTLFDVERVIVRVNDADCADAYDRPGVEPVDVNTTLANAIVDRW